jgi:hypothetical protein
MRHVMGWMLLICLGLMGIIVPRSLRAQAPSTITNGTADTSGVGDSFSISGSNFNLVSGTPDGNEGVSYAITKTADQFQLVTTISADASPFKLGLPCAGGQSGGSFGGIAAQCLQGSLKITTLLNAYPFSLPQENLTSTALVSGNISGWNSNLIDATSTEVFDVSVQGAGLANIFTGPTPEMFSASYSFAPAPVPTPEPPTILLFGAILVGLMMRQWMRRHNDRKFRN